MGERDWLESLPRDAVPGGFGIGDDAACLPGGILATVDALVAGVHFVPDCDPQQVARKLLGVNLSDIAAMGGTPVWALLTLAAAPGFAAAEFLSALQATCRQHGVILVGGDSVSSPVTVLSLTLLGRAGVATPRRSGACPGDVVFVTGALGGAVASGRHLNPRARLEEGRWLAGMGVCCLTDLSDGLGSGLTQLACESEVAFYCDGAAIPIHGDVPVGSSRERALAALGDGEDFELLGTCDSKLWETLQSGPHSLYRIGEVQQGNGVTWTPPGASSDETLPELGYEHSW